MFLSQINIYPIKSLGGISAKESIVENRGFEFDRRWMLVDEKNNVLTQRDNSLMATIKLEVLKNALGVSFGNETLEIPLIADTQETATVKIWSSRCRARVYEGYFNRWFSNVLQKNCKLVTMPEETQRKVNYFYAAHKNDTVSFADGYPILLAGEHSLADLNSRLEMPVPMNRFRPNLVVSDTDAFAEDGWKQIKIGAVVFHVVKPCGRCIITTIDQTTGEKQGVEPLKTLATYRIPKRSIKKKILFGQYLIPENSGEVLSVNDKIEIIEAKNKPVFV
jgi:uncharacterized protein YcbX